MKLKLIMLKPTLLTCGVFKGVGYFDFGYGNFVMLRDILMLSKSHGGVWRTETLLLNLVIRNSLLSYLVGTNGTLDMFADLMSAKAG